MDGLGKPLQLDGLFVGSSHSTPCFIRQQYLSAVLPVFASSAFIKNFTMNFLRKRSVPPEKAEKL